MDFHHLVDGVRDADVLGVAALVDQLYEGDGDPESMEAREKYRAAILDKASRIRELPDEEIFHEDPPGDLEFTRSGGGVIPDKSIEMVMSQATENVCQREETVMNMTIDETPLADPYLDLSGAGRSKKKDQKSVSTAPPRLGVKDGKKLRGSKSRKNKQEQGDDEGSSPEKSDNSWLRNAGKKLFLIDEDKNNDVISPPRMVKKDKKKNKGRNKRSSSKSPQEEPRELTESMIEVIDEVVAEAKVEPSMFAGWYGGDDDAAVAAVAGASAAGGAAAAAAVAGRKATTSEDEKKGLVSGEGEPDSLGGRMTSIFKKHRPKQGETDGRSILTNGTTTAGGSTTAGGTTLSSSTSGSSDSGPRPAWYPSWLAPVVPQESPLFWTSVNNFLAIAGCLLLLNIIHTNEHADPNYPPDVTLFERSAFMVWEFMTCIVWIVQVILSATYQSFKLQQSLWWYTHLEIACALYFLGTTIWMCWLWKMMDYNTMDLWEICLDTIFFIFLSIRGCYELPPCVSLDKAAISPKDLEEGTVDGSCYSIMKVDGEKQKPEKSSGFMSGWFA